jgi:hypothetical protein
MVAGDWAAPLADLERRVLARLERQPSDELRAGASESVRAEAVSRVARAELLGVLRSGLSAGRGVRPE